MRALARSAAAAVFVFALELGALGQTRLACGPAVATCGPAIVEVGASTAGSSWVSSMLAVWFLDEVSGTRVNAQGTTSRDLTNVTGTDPTSSTDAKQGPRSAVFAGNQARWTNDTFPALVSPITAGCWVKGALTGNNSFMMHDYQTAAGSFKLMRNINGYEFDVYDASATLHWCGGIAAGNTWAHVVGTVVSGDTVKTYINGLQGCTTPMGTSAARNQVLYLGENNIWSGQLDECFVTDQLLSPAAICRLCSCGMDGALCMCAGASFVTKGRNASECNSCALPANCSAATPP